ncbi:MAG: HAD family hydrolase [Armatimonadetes bacterium]|nr:HAD family hydrolase [Armatimonadota bacterium]
MLFDLPVPCPRRHLLPAPSSGSRRAVFLDRDGVLTEDRGYLSDAADLRLLEGAAEALHCLRAAGWALVVVTNQSAVARGMLTEEGLAAIHARLQERLSASGARVDAIYYCPHHPEAAREDYRRDCPCRKPAPGMLLAAAADLNLDLSASWLVGDQERDIEAAQRAGVRGILLADPPPGRTAATAVVPSLREAVGVILDA